MTIRSPAVAGQFYNNNPTILRAQIEYWLSEDVLDECRAIRAVIVPHAGYIYSGQTAARAYALVRQQKDKIKKVLLVGPSHRVYFKGCAVPACDQFCSPLGNLDIAQDTLKLLKENTLVTFSDSLHQQEHSLEVQLPFLQVCLNPEIRLMPLLVCDISASELATIIDALWDEETLLVISSDLSHFHTYTEANRIDRHTCHKIAHFQAEITPQEACGCTGINALLLLAKKNGYQLEQLQHNNSGDTSGDLSRVVGYVSYITTEL
ncbi:AmmeMemoRadiSam system protein B [Vibrio salinus]|uniref:AmmeMemoRadiSam system protein B n=1 Tax=Vibrio salinus TaxID=2899784 RepID=UPI001E4D0580|nr:AmmeMemoRadiSam system protein B [Vibrio salinus]MCE0495514.1 AmmeMemoRadiSam system protein B [Vibrio salinus]